MSEIEKHILSKSSYLTGEQCLKALYFYKNHYRLRDPIPPERQALFDRGHEVGRLAQKRFPGGVDSSPPGRFKFREAVEMTKAFLAEGKEVIYEATFQYQQVLVAMDVLVKTKTGYIAYEVKSSGKITPTFLTDVALQYFVITGAGVPLEDLRLLHINTKYVRGVQLDLGELFTYRSLLKEAQKRQPRIQANVVEFKRAVKEPQAPTKAIGPHCFSPYECHFRGQCWKSLPKDSIFELAGLSRSEQFALYDQGFKTIGSLPEDQQFPNTQEWQVKASKSGKTIVKKKALKAFMDQLKYPLLFVDFEVFMPAIPLFSKTHPYQHLPFQFSLHSLEKGKEVKHQEFLSETGIDPRASFLETFLDASEGKGSILVFDANLERDILTKLKAHFPDKALAIDSRLSRIVDLQKPILDGLYYHPDMQGHNSIKWVLPALASDLNYKELTINNGRMASSAFAKLQKETDLFNLATIPEALLAYCKMDTLGLVRIHEALEATLKA